MVEHKKIAVVMVFNDSGELALQLRAANDYSFPAYWDFSAGGGIDEGEDSKFSAERETKEELGIDITAEPLGQEHYQYPAWKPGILREVDIFIFRTHHNGPFKPNPAEVEQVQFFKLEVIQDMIDSGAKFHPEFLLSWDKGIIHRAGKENLKI